MSGDVGWLGAAASLLLVAITIGISRWRRLGVEREVAWATVRAAAQLLAVGYALTLVIDDDAPIAYAWLWLAAMVPFAAWTVARRASEVPGVFRVSLLALVSSTAICCLVIFGLGIFPVEARAVVPVGGMIVGNSMKAVVIVGQRLVAEARDKRDQVEARLALGHSWVRASRPLLRDALRTGLSGQIETTKAVGLVFLPGAMTGLILAGVDPVDAVRVQAAVMFLILGAVAINGVVIGIAITRLLFSSDHRLRVDELALGRSR